jgi:hypothetical protein
MLVVAGMGSTRGDPYLPSQAEAAYPVLPPVQGQVVYLPFVGANYCNEQDAPMKCWSGEHLGNRASDWDNVLLQYLDPQLLQTTKWPRVVVVLSPQVYTVDRSPAPGCRVQNPTGVRSPVIMAYLKRAALAGTKVIIRLWPSPGNFIDWFNPSRPNHQLITDPIPVGNPNYCQWGQNGDPGHRSIDDIVDEIQAIHSRNVISGFEEFGFEVANEPNNEWYFRDSGSPTRMQDTAWSDMNVYFAAIYDRAHQYVPGVRILTPPMAQGGYAERYDVTNCNQMNLQGHSDSGYSFMPQVYGSYTALNPKNDGTDWHNYWGVGKESWLPCMQGHHVLYYFPPGVKVAIANYGKPTAISEADIFSPQQWPQSIPTKDGAYAAQAADSVRHFFQIEQRAAYTVGITGPVIASWQLNDDFVDQNNIEIRWHNAYTGTDPYTIRTWFTIWYPGSERWP